MMRRTLSLALCLAMTSTTVLTPAFAQEREKISLAHRGELFVTGTITDQSNKVWRVLILPGLVEPAETAGEILESAGKDLKRGAKSAGESLSDAFTIDLKHFVDGKFYSEMGEQSKNGFDLATDSFTEYLVKGISDDLRSRTTENDRLERNGGTFTRVQRAANNIWFVTKSLGRIVSAPIAAAFGLGYSVVAPVAMGSYQLGKGLVYRPTSALLTMAYAGVLGAAKAVGGGVAMPAVVYVYNGLVWVPINLLTINAHVPNSESRLIRLISGREKVTYNIDSAGFSAIISQNLHKFLLDENTSNVESRYAPILAEIARQIASLQEQRTNQNDLRLTEKSKLQNEYQRLPEVAAAREVVSAAQRADVVNLDEQVSAELDTAKLGLIVKELLEKENVEATEERINTIVSKIESDIKSLVTKMQ